MVSTLIKPLVSPTVSARASAYSQENPVVLWDTDSGSDFEIVVRAAYKQILGNAYVMESERLAVAESQLKQGNITVRDFVKAIATSDLYKKRFFEPCSRNRFIELNFKHLLGRAPASRQEFAEHGAILDDGNYEAEIDSYLQSEEYSQAFGDNTVPYYRGQKTLTGQSLSGYNYLTTLFKSNSSSDVVNNKARLTNVLSAAQRATSLRSLAAQVLLDPDSVKSPTLQAPTTSPVRRRYEWIPPAWTSPLTASKQSAAVSSQPTTTVDNPPLVYQQYDIDPVELAPNPSREEVDVVIRAAYRQVFGNAHVMESERLAVPESKLRMGEISVREFVRLIAKSDFYRARFFEPSSRNRFIELNFKHLLGRAPTSAAEIALHSALLETKGYSAEINSYIDGDEYQDAFGEMLVPYYRGAKTQVGQKLASFTNLSKVLRGFASSDLVTPESELNRNVMSGTTSAIEPVSGRPSQFKTAISAVEESKPEVTFDTFRSFYAFDLPKPKKGISSVVQGDPVVFKGKGSVEEFDIVIRAAYKQVLGNAYVMESERLTVAESQLKQGNITVREFVKAIATSELYRTRFFEPCNRNRFIELNFKHLLGRAPESVDEVAAHARNLDQGSYETEIASYVESEEYKQAFGDDTVPYYRGNKTQTGQRAIGFSNLAKLVQSNSNSDRANNNARLTRELLGQRLTFDAKAAKIDPTSRLKPPSPNDDYRNRLKWETPEKVEWPVLWTAAERKPVAKLPTQKITGPVKYEQPVYYQYDVDPVELLPNASNENVDVVIRAVYRQVLGNIHIMESERLTGPESQLRNGSISVREFIRLVAKSGLYQARFFEPNNRNRFIELNFKHLLGRAPANAAEIAFHSNLLETQGYSAEINSYLDGDEYQAAFGESFVPFYRGTKTQAGQDMVVFTHMSSLLGGYSNSDHSSTSSLNVSLLSNVASRITPASGSGAAWQSPEWTASPGSIDLAFQPKQYTNPFKVKPQASPLANLFVDEPATEATAEAAEVTVSAPPERKGRPYVWKAPVWNEPIPVSPTVVEESEPVETVEAIPYLYKQYAADATELCANAAPEDFDIVIRAVYRQVLGNAYVMESERLTVPESQLRNGQITVRDFVRMVAKSDLYRARFFEANNRNRFTELNFKHLLGRAPEGVEEIAFHSNLLESEGYGADIDSYLDSDEYQNAFGEYFVPFYRGTQTLVGQKLVGFTHLSQILRGNNSSDKGDRAQGLAASLMSNSASTITASSAPKTPWEPPKRERRVENVNETLAKLFGFDHLYKPDLTPAKADQSYKVSPASIAPTYSAPSGRYGAAPTAPSVTAQWTGPALSIPGVARPTFTTEVIEKRANASTAEIDVVIRAVYKQVLGNAHLMDNERLVDAESKLINGDITVREFVRWVAKSSLYRARFFEPCSRNRFIEVNFKHLLGRAPSGYDDIASHSAILEEGGYEADIDSYLDSEEYTNAFGENIVPYYRGATSQVGQSVAGYTHMSQLLRGTASSDIERNESRLNANLMSNDSSKIEKTSSTPYKGNQY